MKTPSHSEAFSRMLANALLDLKSAIEAHDKLEAHTQYALALGMVGGAALSGGLHKDAAKGLLAELVATRKALLDTFGEVPDIYPEFDLLT